MDELKGKIISSGRERKSIYMQMKFTKFALPPVRDALVIGKKAHVGSNAIERAFDVMLPGMYKVIKVKHPCIEAVMVRKSILRKIKESIFIPKILEYAEALMDETDSLRIEIDLEVTFEERLEVE